MAKDIAHQNKDILFKVLSQSYKNKSFKAYGLDLPPIKELLPTNLPAVKADEKRADNIFLLQDGTILILEYESVTNEDDLWKYGHYIFRVAENYRKKFHDILSVVIYTGDVEKAQSSINYSSIKINVEQVFLAKFDGGKIYSHLKHKIDNNLNITDEDIMNFIILPLTERKEKQKLIEKSINLAKEVKDEEKQLFIIAGIVTVTDKFIDKEYSNKIKEWIKMTKVARLFEEEKEEALKKKDTIIKRKDEIIQRKDEVIQKKDEALKQIIKNMLIEGTDINFIMKTTGASETEIKELQKSLDSQKN